MKNFQREEIQPLQLLLVQPTPFCNINCKYCYLPNRDSRERMNVKLLSEILENIYKSNIVQSSFVLLWHAGEPLSIPISFYREAFEVIKNFSDAYGYEIVNTIQTNGTLITDELCHLFKQYNVEIGVSIDGPKFLHDNQRVTRSNQGTFDKTIQGIQRLQQHGILVKTISVLTSTSLDYPDEIYQFFKENNLLDVAFNVEEAEGIHYQSSLQSNENYDRCQQFFSRFYDLAERDNWKVFVREFSLTAHKIIRGEKIPTNNIRTIPFSILNVDFQGNFSTFSPELLQTKSPEYNNFILGNVRNTSIADVIDSSLFQKLYADIKFGVSMCRQECEYFSVCSGGCPSNKYAENRSMRSSETDYCKLHVKGLTDVVLKKLERKFDGMQLTGILE
jgi:uncharacterized protein